MLIIIYKRINVNFILYIQFFLKNYNLSYINPYFIWFLCICVRKLVYMCNLDITILNKIRKFESEIGFSVTVYFLLEHINWVIFRTFAL